MVYNNGVSTFDPPVGQLKAGTIVGYDKSTNTVLVQLNEAPAVKGNKPIPVSIPASFALADVNGLFIGALPGKNTPVVVGQGAGNQYYFVSHKPENLPILPDLNIGEILIHSTNSSYISLDLDSNINIGSDTNKIHIFAGSQKLPKTNFITINFENENHFTQAYREVGGLVKRDVRPNLRAASFTGDTKLEDDNYDSNLLVVGMDPSATANNQIVGATKNPPFVEHREIVYEFQYNSNIDDDITESTKYGANIPDPTIYTTANRRQSRSDTLSLSLVSPNYLMEQIKGTVIDKDGKILDINRSILQIGQDPSTTIRPKVSTDQAKSFTNIRALERKSIAYHFEINSRKDPNAQSRFPTSIPLDINADNYNAKLQRSRFFFDVDKEGQFKLNVPASSETGNIPLLARYENYSTFGTDDSNNPNKSWIQANQPDIFLDSVASPKLTPNDSGGRDASPDRGSVKLLSGDAETGPMDRLTQSPIRHGMPHHDILQTCMLHQNNSTILFAEDTDPNPLDLSYIDDLIDLVSTTIQTKDNGQSPQNGGANAGGRSGSIHMDGSFEFSLGANTIDRQSLWMDTAGGIVGNFGRDRNQRSALLNFDGDCIIQIGGFGVSGDARFASLGQDGLYNAVLDLRVYASGFAHMLRIDSNGITILSPGNIAIHSAQDIKISSDADVSITAENLVFTVGGIERPVLQKEGSI